MTSDDKSEAIEKVTKNIKAEKDSIEIDAKKLLSSCWRWYLLLF